MSEESDSAPLLVSSLFSAKALVECRVNLVSDFDPKASSFVE
jgi:hypothetical protein